MLFFLLLLLSVAEHVHQRPAFLRRTPHTTPGPANRQIVRQIDDAVSLTVTPGGPLSGDTVLVTVAWSGVTGATTEDWLGFYCPSDADSHDYLDYAWNPNGAGSGSVQFNVTNMRDGFQFRYIANNTAYILVATSNTVTWVPHQPLQARIALTENEGEMRVMWNSDYNTDAPTVQWGVSSGNYNATANGTSHTYKATDMCNSPATDVDATHYRNPGYFHDVLLSGLKPNTRYYYRYGQNSLWSTEKSFLTPPPTGPDSGPIKFVMYGDHGAVGCFGDHGGCSAAPGTVSWVLNEIKTNDVNLILHIGDISYAVSYGYLWEMYGTEIEPIATLVPYMVANGNHEYDHTGTGGNDPSGATGSGWHPTWGNFGDDSGGECSVPFSNRYHMPDNGNLLFWYSFNYGPVHFIVMSSEHDWTPNSAQYNWLQKDLMAVNRSVTPWLILNIHRPMYSSENYQGDWTVAQNMQKAFEPLLLQYNVDLVLTGHYHAYERTCPVYQQECCATGKACPVHIVAGMAGIDLDDAGWFKTSWSAYHDESNFGYTRITINTSPAHTLLLEYVSDTNGKTLDSVTLKH